MQSSCSAVCSGGRSSSQDIEDALDGLQKPWQKVLRHPLLMTSVLNVESAGCGWFKDRLWTSTAGTDRPCIKTIKPWLQMHACVIDLSHPEQPSCRIDGRSVEACSVGMGLFNNVRSKNLLPQGAF
jgi:hypothetical protein